jgi:hypothetical protein
VGKASRPNFEVGRGTPGFYRLNQKVQKFGDRRTKRERDRSTKNRNAIDRSRRED